MVGKRKGLRSANLKAKQSKEDPIPNPIIPNPKSPVLRCSGATSIVPSTLRAVLLHDWWLMKVGDGDGQGLAVGGFTFGERVGLRVICSAAISKRHQATILEAKDGITFTISGFINKSRTIENGFPPEVCDRFLLGFPFGWENYVAPCLGSAKQGIKTRISDSDSDISLMCTFGESYNRFIRDSLLQDLPCETSRSNVDISTRRMTRSETRKPPSSNSVKGQIFEEHVSRSGKMTKTRRGRRPGIGSSKEEKKSYAPTDTGRRSSLRIKNMKKNL